MKIHQEGNVIIQRPPPAQAQAQPAQAQAQAQELPPPPLNPPEPLREDVVLGMGLVRFVMPVVKAVKLPTTPAAMPEAPLITLAAKSDPGIFGREGCPPPEGLPTETAGFPPVPTLPPIDRR